MWLHRLDDADASCGGKAVGLARLIAAGLPVPEGFVIDDRAFRHVIGDLEPSSDAIGHALAEAAQRIMSAELPEDLVREVERRAAKLGLLAVRSSATIEDGDAGAAAGVFSSRTGVRAADVWAAIRAVWASALTPLAVAYARRRGGRIAVGVIIQRFVPGDVTTIYTRPPNVPDGTEILIQRGAEITRVTRAGYDTAVARAVTADAWRASEEASPVRKTRTHPAIRTLVTKRRSWRERPPPFRTDPLPDMMACAFAMLAERAIGAAGGADVEYVEGSRLDPRMGVRGWILQARPIVHRVIATRQPGPPAVIAALLADGRKWTWDVAHNPDPLSPAQAGLVERVDRAEIAAWSLRVCAGFLYAARREDAKPHDVVAPTTIAALDSRVRDLEAAMDAALAGTIAPTTPTTRATPATSTAPTIAGTLALDAEPPSLGDAIERYLSFYAIWATELAPLIAAARANLSPASLAGARPSSVESTVLAAARGELDEQAVLGRIGLMSPAWDVSVATFAERPELVRAAIERAREFLAAARPPSPPPSTAPPSSTAASSSSAAPSNTGASSSTAESVNPRHAAPSSDAAAISPASDTLHHHARVVANETERERAAQLVAAVPERRDTAGELLHHHARSVAAHAERDLARAAADLAERDDVWFARAQWLVRRAILERARELAIDPDDAFWIPLEQLATATALDADEVRRRASGARTAAARAAQWAMPIVVGGEPEEGEPSAGPALRGVGTGPRVTGRVVRFETLASVIAVRTGDIVVTRAVTPALAVLVIGCAALVSETGGLLDHGAALARELGIPCVVGCVDAWQLTEGMTVTVDGDAGTVEIRQINPR